MAQRCAEHVRQTFSLRMIVARHAALYSQLLGGDLRLDASEPHLLNGAAQCIKRGEFQLEPEVAGARKDRPSALDLVLRLTAGDAAARSDRGAAS